VRAIFLLSALIPENHSVIISFCVSVSATVLMFLGMIVYRHLVVAVFDTLFIMNLLQLNVMTLFTTIVEGGEVVAAYTLVGVAFVQFLGLILYKIFSILKRNEKVTGCLPHRRQPAC